MLAAEVRVKPLLAPVVQVEDRVHQVLHPVERRRAGNHKLRVVELCAEVRFDAAERASNRALKQVDLRLLNLDGLVSRAELRLKLRQLTLQLTDLTLQLTRLRQQLIVLRCERADLLLELAVLRG